MRVLLGEPVARAVLDLFSSGPNWKYVYIYIYNDILTRQFLCVRTFVVYACL